MSKQRLNLKSGDKIKGFIYLREAEPYLSKSRKYRQAIFKCKCGKEFRVLISSITSGNTRSCGCFTDLVPRRLRKAKHLMRNHPIYKIWCHIKTRCYNTKRLDYKFYGGSGIRMSEEFKKDFMSFFNHISNLENYENRESLKLTLDRINNNGNYEKGNLRWATRKEQANNRRNNG